MTSDTPASTYTALVTGASSGLGAELTKRIAADGHDLILTARREDRLDTLAATLEEEYDVSTTVLPVDLGDTSGPRALFDEVRDSGLTVTALVNVAGMGIYGRFSDCDLDEQLEMLRVNVLALTELTGLFVGEMIEGDHGLVVNVSGLAGYIPLPKMAVYAATRAYIRSFSEALAEELADSGVQVTTVCPGSIDSEFFEKAGMGGTRLARGSKTDPAEVARRTWPAVTAGDRLVKPGLQPTLLSQLPRVLPETTVTAIGDRQTRRPSPEGQ